MREDIEFILNHDKKADATQIAEVLWLSKYLPKGKTKQKKIDENLTAYQEIEKEHLPREVSHEVIISDGTKSSKTKHKSQKNYSVIRQENSDSSYGLNVGYTPSFVPIKEQFSSLRLKQKKLSTKEIDEVKSADYIANTGIFNPIFKLEKFYEPYFSLNILVDSNESMFLWKESIEHVIKELKTSNYFTKVKYFIFDSSKEKVAFPNTTMLKEEKVLNLVFTDTVGKAWRNNQMYLLLDEFSKKSFTAIVSMLPKQMWQRTSLEEGERRFMKNRHFPPSNRTLKAEHTFIEESFSNVNIKVPVIPYDGFGFEYLSEVILATKGSLVETRVFEDLKHIELDEPEIELDAQTRVKKFFNTAQPQAKELAIYCSVLPLNNVIIKETIHVKNLGNIDAFTEFYFGGLLDKKKKATIGTYEFYEGVQKELLQHISVEVAKELWEILAEVTVKSLGLRFNFIELLNEVDSNEVLDDKEQSIVDFLLNILVEKGECYQKDIDRLNSLNNVEVEDESDVIHPKTNTYQMGSNTGDDDEKPIHQITFDYDFEIAKHPVTFEEYDLYCEDTKTKKPDDRGWGRGKRPVINVSWNDAQAYCTWLSEKTNKVYRLPTEAEWEYACRAGTTTKWSFRDDENELGRYAWYNKNSDSKTHPVGKKLPNPWGLYDMHGNVWEWCQDDWVDNYNDTPRDGTAYKGSERKVVRGGSWDDLADYTRSAFRNLWNLTDRDDGRGFRLLITLP